MPFPRLYDDQTCPLDGYAGYTFRVLLNPTGLEKTEWFQGNLGIDGCADCAKLNQLPPFDGATTRTAPARAYCKACTLARDRMGRAAVAIYGTSHVDGFDFTTPAASLATLEQAMPDELLAWLYMLPLSLWEARSDDLKKKLSHSPPTLT